MKGLTLTSLMIAVALSGVVSVFATRLVVDQMAIAGMLELTDKGNSIMNFYGSMLRDSQTVAQTVANNINLKKFLKTGVSSFPKQPIALLAPDGSTVLPSSGLKLDDSINKHNSNGWWQLKLEAMGISKGAIDFILSLCLNKSKYDQYSGRKLNRKYRYQCLPDDSSSRSLRLRHTDNPIKNNCTGTNKAVVSVTHRGVGSYEAIDVKCGPTLLSIPTPSPTSTIRPYEFVKVTGSTAEARRDRRGVKPTTSKPGCGGNRPIVGFHNGEIICSGEPNGGDGVLINTNNRILCPVEGGIDQVVCGITNSGGVDCCSRKGPKGPKGPKGCTPYVEADSNGYPRRLQSSNFFDPNKVETTGSCGYRNRWTHRQRTVGTR